MQRALAEGTEDARLFYHAGLIAEAVGANDEAHRWFEKADAQSHILLPSQRAELAKRERGIGPRPPGFE